jgi:putative heme-binding domain-containing protein
MLPSFKPDFMVGLRRIVNALALFVTIPLAGPVALAESPIPTQTPEDLAHGRRLFQGQCARCHGMDGAGGTGPGLNRSILGRAPDDQALFSVIREGIPSTEMPRAWQMIDGEIWQVAGYVRSLGRTARVPLPGEPERGQRLYETKGRCATCHIVRGRGGSLGPDLTEIGARRGVSHLRSALLSPGSSKARDSSGYISYLVMRVATQDGREVRGIRINEDTFTLQLRDADNRVHSFRKDDLKELKRESSGSLMPSYQTVFSPTEIDDLIAYLASLRGER